MTSLRGNVPTRLKKLDGEVGTEKYDAIVLAVAGLKRLGLEKRITHIFEPSEMMPAPGQGILVIEARSGNDAGRDANDLKNDFVLEILKKINDADAMRIARIERSFARATGAGCKSPTGAYAFRDGSDCRLLAMISRETGSNIVRGEMRAPWGESEKLGMQLAEELLAKLPSS
jgi:hydroxymethylbilane synthase